MGSQDDDSSELMAARAFIDRSPGIMEAIAQRCSEIPEYRVWLEQFNPAILQMLERNHSDRAP